MSSQNSRTVKLQRILSQPVLKKRRTDDTTSVSLSQPIASTSANIPLSNTSQDDDQLVNSVIRYLLILDGGKQIVNKTRIIKNVFGNQGKRFLPVMNKAKSLLSKVFGYELVELEGNKYMLVNKIKNELPHICPLGSEGSQQVLLFIVLTHIFMLQNSCSEGSLSNFLANLDIPYADNIQHVYFGNVKYLINEVFVAQKYLDKITTETINLTQIEFKWGPRAVHEFSQRAALEFMSEVYNGRPIKSWQLQFQALTAQEKLDR
ncbi:non-structural maintenance of chromosomes element 3 homolog [Bombus fervidus]|uniref:non-structural maintenance of chromosomes element 3 homolog n=1 Tax=Bombus fervidus TaxID=203811 RepID=UPI003AB221A8